MNPYDWTKENYYRELWLAEGCTSYLDNLILVRSRLSSSQAFLQGLGARIRSDRQRPGNLEESLSDCSYDAWIRAGRSSQDGLNFQTDFYERGAAVSMMLDLSMRHATKNRSSIDDLLRLMYKRFPPESPGYTVDDLRSTAVELGGAAIDTFFTEYVFGSKPLAWEEHLRYAGIQVTPQGGSAKTWSGLQVGSERGAPVVVRAVYANSPGAKAGLDIGDQILAVNGFRVGADDFQARIQDVAPGDTVTMALFRRDELRTVRVIVEREPVPQYSVAQIEQPDALQRSIFESWIGRGWNENQ
jgi:predicted metalloprotease with PDZ domain